MKIGILAVQGAFAEHKSKLEKLGADCVELRKKEDLDSGFYGLVLPGGESTVQGKLLRELEMFALLKEKIQAGLPVLATCAGLILLADHLSNDGHVYFGTMPVTVKRNAYGRQLGSFHTEEEMKGIGKVPMTFIRAPYIEKCGEVRFETKLVDLIVENNQIKEVVLENKEGTYKEKVDQLVLAIGHSARNTYEMLYQKQLEISQKAFAVGMRIEHSQEFINKSQYGKFYNHPALKAADYKLAVHTSQKRGVYTFCMCPGGYVMNAASEENRLVVNGMSNYKRDNKFANSAILVNVTPDDFGSSHPLAGMYFQRKVEEKAFELGGSDYSIPVQRVEDYLENKESKEKIETSLKRVKNAQLNALLPEILNINLKEGLLLMNNKINGFTSDATLLGVESRSSAPIRFYRDDNMESNIKGIYPIGEGAGYAGGIMSSAIDGLKCSEVLLKGER